MAISHLPKESQVQLQQRGYSAVELTEGWEERRIPLYTHKRVNDKQPGDIAFTVLVSNPVKSAEAAYLARKGGQGFMAWKPEECFGHSFPVIEIVQIPGGGRTQRVVSTSQGCRWCRDAAQTNGSQGAAGEDANSLAKPAVEEAPESAPPVVAHSTAPELSCTECGFVPKEADKNGRKLTEPKRRYALAAHQKRAHPHSE